MSSIVTEQGILHYESIGRGKPLILLHGWINSWDVWRDSMIALASEHNLRIYALDFWGFGDSAKSSPHHFQIDSYVDMVYQFMETLGILHSPIFGHSMGGTVALKFALRHPERTTRVAIVGSPIDGQTLNFFLKLSGVGWIADLVWRFPLIRDMVMKIILAGDSRNVRSMISRDVQRTSMQSFFRSIADLRDTDLREEIDQLLIPILGIFGSNDNIVSPRNAKILQDRVTASSVAMMQSSRHFPMMDEPDRFLEVLVNFLKEGPQPVILPEPLVQKQAIPSLNGFHPPILDSQS